MSLNGFHDGVHLWNGHEQNRIALVESNGHAQAEGHDMEKGIDGDVDIFTLFQVGARHIIRDVIDIGSHSHMIPRNALGKPGRAAV